MNFQIFIFLRPILVDLLKPLTINNNLHLKPNDYILMPAITEDRGTEAISSIADTLPSRPNTADLRKVGGVILPSKTWVPFVAGAVGGMSGAVLTAPLDVVKTRLQSDFYKERLQAVKKVGNVTTTRIGVWGHLVDTGAIIRYKRRFVSL